MNFPVLISGVITSMALPWKTLIIYNDFGVIAFQCNCCVKDNGLDLLFKEIVLGLSGQAFFTLLTLRSEGLLFIMLHRLASVLSTAALV